MVCDVYATKEWCSSIKHICFQMNIGFKLEHKGQLFALDEHCHFYTIMPEKREASLAAICLELLQY